MLRWLAAQGAATPTSFALDANATAAIRPELRLDAKGLLYSSTISMISAIESLQSSLFSWSIIKLYYSSFYSARSILAYNDIALFYMKSKPFSIHVAAGQSAKKEDGVTHKVVWQVFRRELGGSSILNQIETDISYEWLRKLREEVNYRNAKFPDPLIPDCFSNVDANGIGRSMSAYFNDATLLYVFDREHSVLAFPLHCLTIARRAMRREGEDFEPDEISYIQNMCDKLGVDTGVFLN